MGWFHSGISHPTKASQPTLTRMDKGFQWDSGIKTKASHHPAETRMDKGLRRDDFFTPKGGEMLSIPPLMVAPEKSAEPRLANH